MARNRVSHTQTLHGVTNFALDMRGNCPVMFVASLVAVSLTVVVVWSISEAAGSFLCCCLLVLAGWFFRFVRCWRIPLLRGKLIQYVSFQAKLCRNTKATKIIWITLARAVTCNNTHSWTKKRSVIFCVCTCARKNFFSITLSNL